MKLLPFLAMVSLLNLFLFQGPLLTYAFPFIDLGTSQGLVQLVSIEIIQFILLFLLLLFVSFLGAIVLKGFVVVMLLTNAAALYFMNTYGVELDRTMIGNILNTDSREAGNLFHPKLLLYLAGFGVIPTVFILKLRIVAPRWFWRPLAFVAGVAVLVAWLYATAFTWLWYDQHASRMGGRILPWSYVINTARHFSQTALAERDQVLLPAAKFGKPLPDGQRTVVILVVGEAARAANFSQYGYGRETNPFTKATDLVALPVGKSCSTNTIGSLACILTHEGSEASASTSFEPLPSYLTRHGVETLWRSNNSGPPPMKVSRYETASEIAGACSAADCPGPQSDAALLWGLEDFLTSSTSDRIFVGLHGTGSHGPAYFKKYPPEFAHFTPVCDTVQIADCSPEALVNAYDNTIRYTDFLLSELIAILSRLENSRVALIYVSDHGQSLGENGLYLHGAPLAVAPDVQREVPFLAWMSSGFQAANGLAPTDLLRDQSSPHDFPFHSVLGAFGMTSEIYNPQFDIFAPR